MQTLKKSLNLLILLVIVILAFSGIASSVEANYRNNNIVKVAWYTKGDFDGTRASKDRMYYSLEDDYYQKLSEVTGLEFKYIPATFEESLAMLQSGRVDVVAGVAYIPKRAKLYTYIMPPMSFSTVSLLEKDNTKEYYYEEDKNIQYTKVEELSGKKIGIEEKYKNQYLELLKGKKIDQSTLKIVPYSSYEVMKKALLEDKLNYIIAFTTPSAIRGLRETIRLKTTNLYFCANRDSEYIIEKLNKGLRAIKKSNPNYNDELYYNHFKFKTTNLYYTPREKIALNNLNELIFYVPNNKPLKYNKAKDGTETGYYAYYIKDLAIRLGKKYEIIPVSKKVLQESKIPGFYLPIELLNKNNDKLFLKNNFKYDPKYLTNVTRKNEKIVCVNNGVAEISDGAVYGSASQVFCERLLEKGQKVIYTKNDFESLKLLSECKVDVVAVDSMLTNYINDLIKYNNIKILKFTKPVNEYMVGINGINADVFSAINKTISLIPEKDSKIFMVNESKNHVYNPNLTELLKNHSLIFMGLGLLVLIAILIFIRTLIKKNNRIRQLALKAAEAKKSKNSFLSKISHEMRTPLNAIISFADFGIEEKRDAIYAKYFQKIKFSADTLLVLMQDVLQLEKKSFEDVLDEGKIVKISMVKAKIESIIRPLAEAKNIELEILFDSEIQYVKIEVKTVQQLLLNILTNAVKYTKPGGKIIWKAIIKKGRNNKVSVTHIISDNGVGISEEFQKHMFEAFTTENNELSKTEIGTGLGLAISKKNIEKLGGKISCKSKLGEGSTFTIEFEILLANKDEIKEYEEKLKCFDKSEVFEIESAKKKLDKKLKILLCEDVEINAQIVIKILNKKAIDVDWVKNGKLGVEKALQNNYDVILMDIRMPIMDGLKATELIREKDKKVIIIALSANVYERDKLKSLEAGMDEHLGKPINKNELLKTIYRLVFEKNKI